MDVMLVTEPCMMCTDDMCSTGVYIWGVGKKFYVLTKHVKKKYIFV